MEDAQCYFNVRPVDHQRRRNPATQMGDLLPKPCHSHLLISGAASILILMLVGTVAILGIWALQMKETLNAMRETCAFRTCSPETELGIEYCQTLRRFLCKINDSYSIENSSCRFCPENWLLHEDKCFWVSKIKQTWNNSQKDCKEKDAQLVVVQGQEEMDFIQNITEGAKLLWIGLATSPAGNWTWVDGSPLNHTLLQVQGESQAHSCGMLKRNKVISEACSAVTKWICEKDSLLV
ncbi:killer cell lectin-like receptor subfamily B member 1B allele C [Tiliqua scincoides]|uniref:killer cell lectin-like receptor subfamily B member 1B allele C n=1 Tax=Tiliqua scincoides TaxID=71010 RepID=UPI003461A974